MKLTQISIFLENKSGRLYEACTLLGENDINIRALTVAESADFGILRIVVDKPNEALSLLKENGFASNSTKIVAVEVEDTPGGLSDILKVFSENEINVEYMYGFVEKFREEALLVFRFENTEKALEVLKKNHIKAITEGDIVDL
ncbi:MAG: ACT domain-containing protein [Candidatus Saelkia tenebricola]|nr:ACT domain-containing protein [Candidatus Saelkia tenebricola]